jgi:hypothetical protein
LAHERGRADSACSAPGSGSSTIDDCGCCDTSTFVYSGCRRSIGRDGYGRVVIRLTARLRSPHLAFRAGKHLGSVNDVRLLCRPHVQRRNLRRNRRGTRGRTHHGSRGRTHRGSRGRTHGGNAETLALLRSWVLAQRTRARCPSRDNKKDSCNNRGKDSHRSIRSAGERHRPAAAIRACSG